VVNEDADQRTLLRKYERELRRLRAELTRRNKELVDKRHLLEVRAGQLAALDHLTLLLQSSVAPLMSSCTINTVFEQ
jgi:hypothetical protein